MVKTLTKETSLKRLGFDFRTLGVLERAGILTVGDLQEKSIYDLWNIKGLGPILVIQVLRKSRIFKLGLEDKPLMLDECCETFPSTFPFSHGIFHYYFRDFPLDKLKNAGIRKFGHLAGIGDEEFVRVLGREDAIKVLRVVEDFGFSCGKEELLKKLESENIPEKDEKPKRIENLHNGATGLQCLSWLLVATRRAEKKIAEVSEEVLPDEVRDAFTAINKNISDILEWYAKKV